MSRSISLGLLLFAFSSPAFALDAKGLDAKGKVKVFVLAGQSNMEGHGRIQGKPGQKGVLTTLVTDPSSAKRYVHLVDGDPKDAKWKVRDDVFVSYYDSKGPLTVGGFAARGAFGPELGFGWVLGDYLEEPVLLIKYSPGGCSLAGPFRPPSSGPASGKGGEKKPRGKGVGDHYDAMIAAVKKQLANLGEDFPACDGRGYEIVGFGWHQGWNDGCSRKDSLAYDENLRNFIRDVRKDLGVPELPFVIGGSGFGGWGQKIDRRLMIMDAQKTVAESKEFREHARYVETRGFFRAGDVTPRPIRYHWCCNAESYYLIGEAMGRSMLELLGGPKAPALPRKPSGK